MNYILFIILLIPLLWAMYYWYMGHKYNCLNKYTLGQRMEYKMAMETIHQAKKRGYKVMMHYEEKDDGTYKLKVKDSNIPPGTGKLIMIIIALKLILAPGWWIHEFDDEEDYFVDGDILSV